MPSNKEIVELSDSDSEYVKYILKTSIFGTISEYFAALIKNDRGDYSESLEGQDRLRDLLEKRSKGSFVEINKEEFLEECKQRARKNEELSTKFRGKEVSNRYI